METILLVLIPEAIYFALFMILIKGIDKNRIIFTILTTLAYLMLGRLFYYDLKFQFSYIFAFYLIMKIMYKGTKVTDVFLIILFYMIVIIISSITYIFSYNLSNNIWVANFVVKFIMYITMFLSYKRIIHYYKLYCNNWNRKPNLKIKSLTVRNISLTVFYLTLIIISIWLTYDYILW